MNDEQAYAVVGGRGTMTVFEIYVKTTPERLWEAITSEEMRARYSFGVGTVSDWTEGSEYKAGVPGVIDIASDWTAGSGYEATHPASPTPKLYFARSSLSVIASQRRSGVVLM